VAARRIGPRFDNLRPRIATRSPRVAPGRLSRPEEKVVTNLSTVASDGGDVSQAGSIVLVVEDEPDIREMVSIALSHRGYAVIEAEDTASGLERLRGGDVDVVVSDLMMPGGGGRAILAAALALADPPPVLLITGKVEEDLTSELMSAGAAACLEKPFTIRGIVAEVARLSGRAG
jgi:CheY-like chemotaxis protein